MELFWKKGVGGKHQNEKVLNKKFMSKSELQIQNFEKLNRWGS